MNERLADPERYQGIADGAWRQRGIDVVIGERAQRHDGNASLGGVLHKRDAASFLDGDEAPHAVAAIAGHEHTDDYGRRCLLARRLVERGVRFVCVVAGGGGAETEWDAHSDIERNHLRMAKLTDQPVAALVKDLKRRGLLQSTVVLWGGEFGRSPESEKGKGRDHHNTGFTMWVAGGGVRTAQLLGGTDSKGHGPDDSTRIAPDDLAASIYHALGIDPRREYYTPTGRPVILVPHGNVLEGLFVA